MKMQLVLTVALAGACPQLAFARCADDMSALVQPFDGIARAAPARPASITAPARDVGGGFGTPVDPDRVERTLRLRPGARWANVAYGESVRFVVRDRDGSDRSLAWRFDVGPDVTYVDLRNLAPAGFPLDSVRVYVGPDARFGASGE